jgi:hypothetical protein
MSEKKINWYKKHRLEEARFILSIIDNSWEIDMLDFETASKIRGLILKRIKELKEGV